MQENPNKTFVSTVRMDARDVANSVALQLKFGVPVKTITDVFKNSVAILSEKAITSGLIQPFTSTKEAIAYLESHNLAGRQDDSCTRAIAEAISFESDGNIPTSDTSQKVMTPKDIQRLASQAQERINSNTNSAAILAARARQGNNPNMVDEDYESSMERAKEAKARTEEELSMLKRLSADTTIEE